VNGSQQNNVYTSTRWFLFLRSSTTWHQTTRVLRNADDFRLPKYNKSYTQNSLWHAGLDEFDKIPTAWQSKAVEKTKEEVKKHLKKKFPDLKKISLVFFIILYVKMYAISIRKDK
jgi:uncharacterized protein YbdZ (MbtH family)